MLDEVALRDLYVRAVNTLSPRWRIICGPRRRRTRWRRSSIGGHRAPSGRATAALLAVWFGGLILAVAGLVLPVVLRRLAAVTTRLVVYTGAMRTRARVVVLLLAAGCGAHDTPAGTTAPPTKDHVAFVHELLQDELVRFGTCQSARCGDVAGPARRGQRD